MKTLLRYIAGLLGGFLALGLAAAHDEKQMVAGLVLFVPLILLVLGAERYLVMRERRR